MLTSSSLRHRKKPLQEIVKDFDAFPKVESSVEEEKNISGGAILLICACLIIWLVIGELRYYSETHYDYKFIVDTDYDSKLELNIDITVATPCQMISADISDATDQALPFMYGEIKTDAADFDLDDVRANYFRILKDMRKNNVGKLQHLDSLTYLKHSLLAEIVNRHKDSDYRPKKLDACRIHGSLKVNKLAGNFHITSGISLPIVGGGHAHLTLFGMATNFSHRIDKFSFGSAEDSTFVNPLDGMEKITPEDLSLFQYYIKIVPAKMTDWEGRVIKTCQYSVTQRNRAINHSNGSHGMPGIYFKYDLSSVMIEINQAPKSYVELLLRLCSIVGGIYATSGVISSLITLVLNRLVYCKSKTMRFGKKLITTTTRENLAPQNSSTTLKRVEEQNGENSILIS